MWGEEQLCLGGEVKGDTREGSEQPGQEVWMRGLCVLRGSDCSGPGKSGRTF